MAAETEAASGPDAARLAQAGISGFLRAAAAGKE